MSKLQKAVSKLDLRGYVCPYPVLLTMQALSKLKTGDVIEVIIDNPPSCETIPSAVRRRGHKVLDIKKEGKGTWRIIIERG